MPVKGRSFGQERPPLTDLLKNILLRYPDGGQILKEIIQNADDAGATEVKFLFDATTYGTSSLVSPDLAPFQGPALYCYNNAEFTEEDWDGLQRLMRSNKKDNPLKVGRFGIGFNSVYHITDLPSIVSGETVAFLDPHEKYFVRGQPGQAFCMEEPLLTENYDQFEPFHEIFNCSLSQGNHFRGTLFRFPLRTEPSKLSSKVYTKSMVNALFESFQNEASVILHFLKNIDCIRLYERESRGALHHIYSVKVSDDSKAEVRRKRKELTANITPDWDFTAKSAFYTLEVEEHGEGKDCKKRKWFMANQVGTNEGQLIALGKELKLLPWIGMAFPIDSNHCGSHGGRIFCFLPLPPDADCRTGLPVHVNGYFGLTDNRRSLKWPGPDCQNDDTAEWNRLLLRKVGSRVYVSLIENMITNRSVPASELAAHAQLVYSAFPRLHDVKEDWQCLLQPFCTKILAKDIFFTAANRKAGWINLNQAVFNRLGQSGEPSKQVKEVVISSLLKACQPVVTLPGHVLEIVDVYSQESGWQTIKEISPSLVRDVLRESSERACLPVEAEKKLLLLEYVLQDTPENATDLQGVPLLPLENGEFCTFQLFKLQSSASKKVFIATQKHKVGLLPNAKHRLLRNSISLTLKQKLAQLAGINCSTGFPTQLFNLTRNDVPQLLWESFPPQWSRYYRPDQQTVSWTPEDQSHPPAGWLQLLWEWVADQYPSNPSQLEDMPLIPLSVGSCRSLGRLRLNSTIIVAKHWMFTDSLPVTVRQLLTASGCAVIDQLPSYLKHAHIFDYVTPPTPQGVLKVLTMVAKTVCSRLETSSDDVKLQLRSILSKMRSMSTDEVSFLQILPIFRAIDGKHFIACRVNDQKRPVAPQNFSLPEGIQLLDQGEIISSSEEESIRLLKELRMEVQTTSGLLMTRLETYMKGTGYSKLEKNKLMLWILERMEILGEENPGFVPFLRRLSFVPTDSGTRKAPCQLFDHCDQVLSQLLLDYPDAFPSKEFSRPMQKRQSDLGVRCRNNLTALDLVEISNVRSSSPQNGLKKGNALLDVLNQRPNLLTESILGGTSLSDKLREVAWLPRVVHRPDRYPKFLPWYDGDHVCKPKDMCPSSVALLVGASVPVFDDRHVKKEVQDKLGISKNYNFGQVVEQLRMAIVCWNRQSSEPSGMDLIKFQDSIKKIYLEFSKKKSHVVTQFLEKAHLNDWVWHGNGFAPPHKVAFLARFPSNISLHPYLFLLPKEFQALKDFLLPFGVKEEFTDDDLLSVLWGIKARCDKMEQSAEVAIQDLDSCRVILEWVVRGGRTLSDESRSKLVIPVQTSTSQLRLEPCNTCTYCDREFLRRGGSESDVTTDFHLIHEAIPDHLASSLGVPRLSSCLVDPEPFEFEIEEAGQYEPITTRLRNILQEYKEGVGIFKELIQNADDAGASKVCFVVDWRDSPRVKLLTSEMAKCQGPALWAYNNAMFSKKDFENINKLAGETKKEDLDKVGRFGLGFNAVYHLTDVPSFISGEYFVVFDPNMNHIADMIDKKSRPGMKINLAKSKKVLSLFPDQFLPYHELFGCNTKSTKTGTFRYEGTLFRFPLRTKQQAEKSEICPNPYSPDDICRVFESLRESSSTLLLFAQNVKQVRVFEIRKDSNPASALGEPIISISKGVEKIFHSNGADRDGKGMFLRNCSNWWRHRSKEKDHRGAEEGPRRTELMKISISVKESKITKAEECTKQQDTWLVNSCAGNSTSIKIAESDNGCKHGVLPIAGAAVKLSLSKSESESPHYAKIHSVPGEVFCFLPLSFSSGLPVHVNGYFSVHSNRRGIWEEGVGEHDSHKPFEALWNKALMEDALAQAYLQLLEVVTCQADKQYEFHSLWPNPTVISHPKAWKPFIDAFFQKIIDERKPLFLCNKEWRPLQDCLILDSKLAKVTECLSIMNILCVHVLSIPEVLLEGFRACGKTAFINEQTLTEEKFLRHYFFPNVAKVPIEMRDSVLLHVLDRRLSKHRNYDDLFERYACFNCSRDGKTLRKSSELVHPRGQAACLFSEEEKKFPVEQRFLTKERAMMLEDLGMIVDSLSWDGICGRAEWISNRGSKERQRAGYLVHYLNGFLERPSHHEPTAEHKTRLRTARFLPVLEKPKEYAFPWKASTLPAKSLAAANTLYPDNLKVLIGSSQLILDESSKDFGKFTKILKNILELNSKQPELCDILAQLDYMIKHVTASGAQEYVRGVCSAMYDHFQKIATYEKHASKRTLLWKELDRRPWMLVKGQMVTAKRVAMNWNNKDGSPYLYTISDVYNTRYRALVEWYGVKKEFTSDDFLQAIWKLREDTNGKKLTEQQLDVLCNFLGEVYRIQDLDLKNLGKPIPLPSSDSVLHDSTELAINDAPWMEHDSCIQYVHEKIPMMWSYKLGAKDLRTAVLSFCSEPIGQPFGQHELLTDRLNGILKSYPADEGILKELIQNADDANASEIHFVYDPRTHDSDRIFSKNWKDLQGPAICVYNDQRFSRDDIRGIQNLGIGSKVDDAEKTGQYGIGFNAVYHLTDCPSFLSDDEVLCVFDPHRHYVPSATNEHPGRLYNKLDDKFRRNFMGIFSGFLPEFFNLQGGTMFRFPLRRRDKFQSKISETYFSESKIRNLLDIFRNTAKKMLLFLNNVKKISLSEVKDGKLETYSVCCTVSDEEKRSVFAQKIKQHKNTSTDQIPWHNIHYTLTLSDSRNVKQDWLVSQSLGCRQVSPDGLPIPNGKKWGLLPRAGIAACLPSADSGFSSPMRHQAFCFLPLPVYVSLPVHVNGHFALDSARRDLWHDPKMSDERTAWNEFVKRQVVAPTYASLILEAREYMKGYEKQSDRSALFTSEQETEVGLNWYHALFPSTERTADSWKTVGEALYLYLTHNAMPVLPVAHSLPLRKQPERLRHLSMMKTPAVVKKVQVDWRDVAEVFFCHDDLNDSWPLEKCLLDVGIPLLSYTPTKIRAGFKSGGKAKEVDPVAVTDFLRTHSALKDQLPKSVTNTALLDHHNAYALTKYCSKEDGFFENLHGLPLLLTQDEVLRCFTSSASVFCSRFSDLLPSKQEHFLHKHLKTIFESNVSKCSGIVQDFDIFHLSKFKDAVPINWIDSAVHQPWNPSAKSDSRPSEEWLKLLWEFIHHLSFKTGNADILGSIDSWPIIPTTQNCLVTVSMSKTVLNVSSFLNSDSKVDGERRKVLTKLNCPQLENTIMPSQQDFRHGTGSAAVLKHYLALIQSPTDVLYLLDHTMSKENGQGKLSDEEIQQLLTFLQSDVRNLSYISLRNLPFYKTIHGNHVRLSTYRIAYEIPVDQPLNELNTLSKVTNCVFLYQAPMLKALYESVGIQQASSVYFYLSIVFKHFSQLTSPGRISHLQYVRDSLMPSLLAKQHDHQLLHALKELRFIPDKSGLLHQACKFYDSRNKVFSAFLQKMFPPCPFDADEWKEFLLKAGLQTQVTPEQALKYANYVANEVSKANILQQDGIYDKSRILVSYLFENPHLQDHAFLQKIAKIRFVPGAEIRNSLLAVHDAYGCPARSPTSNYVQFEGSVVSEYMDLVWSSAALLSPLVRPPADLQEKLKIHGKPPLQVVLAHTKNVVNRFYDTKQKQVVENLRCTLIEVMDRLYQYFKKCCPSSEPSSSHGNCSPQCLTVCEALRDVPVIMVDKQFLVRGIQLAFKGFLKSLEPHMFNVPRNLFQYEHLLKGLGAQEYPTPRQYATVLQAIKSSCKDNEMHPIEKSTAISAVRGLFRSLHKASVEAHEQNTLVYDESQSLSRVTILYLPSEDGCLRRSTDLLVNNRMEKKTRLKEHCHNLLVDFATKDQEPTDKLVELLPLHLKLQKLSDHISDELDPNCVDKVCVFETNSSNQERCPFIQRYRRLLYSPQFSEALIRLFKSHENVAKVPEKVQKSLQSMQESVEIRCMRSIETRLVSKETGEPIEGSERDVGCHFYQNDGGGFKILIRHNEGEKNPSLLHHELSSFIHQITGRYIKEEKWRFLMLILGCDDPAEIHSRLDEAHVPGHMSNSWKEPDPGEPIPEHFHFLLRSDIDYYLRKGELVAYELQEEDNMHDPVYVFATVIEQTNEGGGRFGFTSRYKIDIGREAPIEVSKLKLYKFDREGTRTKPKKETPETSSDIVPYEGTSTESNTANTEEDKTPSKPTSLEEAKKEVAEALKEIWKLPESERTRAIRRLMLRWHPDKNRDCEDLANEVIKFLLNEVERLKKGGIPGYREPGKQDQDRPTNSSSRPRAESYWDGPDFSDFFNSTRQRARRERQRYEDWQHRSHQSTSAAEPPNRHEAGRWMRQAREDLNAAKYLYESRNPTFYTFSCFHCQQVVEKCLIAVLFAKGRVEKTDLQKHDLLSLAYRATREHESLRILPELVRSIHDYDTKTRYPDYRRYFPEESIPSDKFTEKDAETALSKAQDVLRLITNVLNE